MNTLETQGAMTPQAVAKCIRTLHGERDFLIDEPDRRSVFEVQYFNGRLDALNRFINLIDYLAV